MSNASLCDPDILRLHQVEHLGPRDLPLMGIIDALALMELIIDEEQNVLENLAVTKTI